MARKDWPTPPAGDPWSPPVARVVVEYGTVHDCSLHEGEKHGDDGTWTPWATKDPAEVIKRFKFKTGERLAVRVITYSQAIEIDPDQIDFWTPEWLLGEAEASRHLASGEVTTYGSAQEFMNSLGTED